MTETKHGQSGSTGRSHDFSTKFCCGSFREMLNMMRECFRGGKDAPDCRTMMREMCGVNPEKTDGVR